MAEWMKTSGVALLAGFLVHCSNFRPIQHAEQIPYAGLERLGAVSKFRIAYEVVPACSLQQASIAGPKPPEDGWSSLTTNKLVRKTYQVSARYLHKSDSAAGYDYMALLVKDEDGNEKWWRNAPADSWERAAISWRCVVGTDWAEENVPALKAKYVQLNLQSPNCPAIIPILGGQEDIWFGPYMVVGADIFAGTAPKPEDVGEGSQGLISVGIQLEGDGGTRQLTVPAMVFDRCFQPADRPPPHPEEARALMDWLDSKDAEMLSPPPTSADTLSSVIGTDLARCIKTSYDQKRHFECRAPAVQVLPMPGAGPFGPSVLQLVHNRMVDAIHILNGKLVSSVEVIPLTVAVRVQDAKGSSALSDAFRQEMSGTMVDENKVRLRANRGFRLVSDESASTAPSHFVDIKLNFNIPPVEVSTEKRQHKYVAGKKQVHNKKYDEAVLALEQAQRELQNAKHQVEILKQAADAAADVAKSACEEAAGGGLTGLLAGAACGGVASGAGLAAASARMNSAETQLTTAKKNAQKTPKEVSVDDYQTFEYEAKTYRRRGEAVAEMTITGSDAKRVLSNSSLKVPFDAKDEEIPNDPEHKLVGRSANSPSEQDVQQALFRALIPHIDEAIIRWAAQRQVGGDLGEMRPGTRPWTVPLARRAAGDRPVRLVSDLIENRKEMLDLPMLKYPVKMPADAASRCFTFTAIPLDGNADVNMKLGLTPAADSKRVVSIGMDQRIDPDAAFEVCGVGAGNYVVAITLGSDSSPSEKGILVSMFESTPGTVTDEDTRVAAQGLPTTPRKGQELLLDGSGKVTFVGTAGKVVEGRTGDRDGDRILDGADRCPYDPEVYNGWLDEDGCPDEGRSSSTPARKK